MRSTKAILVGGPKDGEVQDITQEEGGEILELYYYTNKPGDLEDEEALLKVGRMSYHRSSIMSEGFTRIVVFLHEELTPTMAMERFVLAYRKMLGME